MTDLRASLIEAGTRAIDRRYVDPRAHTFEDLAEAALDAVLDVLADRADEWVEAGRARHRPPPQQTYTPNMTAAHRLIAVLRGDT